MSSTFHELELAERLDLARRGLDYVSQQVRDMTPQQYAEPSELPQWSRAHIVAHLAYNAVGIGNLMTWAHTGVETPMYESWEARDAEIERGAVMDPQELEELLARLSAQLEQQWQQMDSTDWSATVRTFQGVAVPASLALWLRTRELWIHGVDLGLGGSFHDFPAVIVDTLIHDLTIKWRGELELVPVGGEYDGAPRLGSAYVTGAAPDLAAWATGRRAAGLRAYDAAGNPTELPEPPQWI